jgi:hypothetical protein
MLHIRLLVLCYKQDELFYLVAEKCVYLRARNKASSGILLLRTRGKLFPTASGNSVYFFKIYTRKRHKHPIEKTHFKFALYEDAILFNVQV